MQIYNKRMHTYLDLHQMTYATNAKNAILNANICRSIFTRSKSQACGKKLCKSWICCSSCFFEVGGTSTNLTSCWDCVNTHHTCTRAARAHTHTHTHCEKLGRQKKKPSVESCQLRACICCKPINFADFSSIHIFGVFFKIFIPSDPCQNSITFQKFYKNRLLP